MINPNQQLFKDLPDTTGTSYEANPISDARLHPAGSLSTGRTTQPDLSEPSVNIPVGKEVDLSQFTGLGLGTHSGEGHTRGQGYNAKQEAHPIGKIIFRPLEIKLNEEILSKGELDLYCKFKIAFHTAKTTVRNFVKGINQQWTEGVNVKTNNNYKATIKVKDANKYFFNGTIGKAEVLLDRVYGERKATQWISLYDSQDKHVGDILLDMEYLPRRGDES